jgi:glycosyltransferase involved in cell wall biosynthesis
MKIAVFHNLAYGGAKRALHGLIKALALMGNSIDVYVPSTADEDFLSLKSVAQRMETLPVRRTALGSMISAFKYVLPVRFSPADLELTHKKMAQRIDASGYDIVLLDQDRFTLSPFLLKYLKTPSVYYCNQPSRVQEAIIQRVSLESGTNGFFGRTARKMWKTYLRSRMPRIDIANAQFAKYILANSAFGHESILRIYGMNSFVCHLGVDCSLFRPLPLTRENFLLSVGAMDPSKGYDFLIRAISKIPAGRRPPLRIISNLAHPGYLQYVEGLAKKIGVALEFRRLVSDEELLAAYNQALIFVYAPYLEPFGLAALEAQACGTPVVAVNEGGIREAVLHNQTGILTDRDQDAFAAAIESLLKQPELRNSFGAAGIQAIQNYWTLEHAAARLQKHLNRALEK